MAEWFFSKKSKDEVERDLVRVVYFVSSVDCCRSKPLALGRVWEVNRESL